MVKPQVTEVLEYSCLPDIQNMVNLDLLPGRCTYYSLGVSYQKLTILKNYFFSPLLVYGEFSMESRKAKNKKKV